MALKISAMKRSEYIALLGSDYDSLEALLTITVPVYNDPISPTMGPYIEGLERDGVNPPPLYPFNTYMYLS